MGHPDYEVTGGSVTYKGQNLFDLEAEERSHAGIFLSFQSPVELPGVNNVDFLRMACNARRTALGQSELDPLEVLFTSRSRGLGGLGFPSPSLGVGSGFEG